MPWLHDLDPVALHVGAVPIRWYALMYFCGYAIALRLAFLRWRLGRLPVAAIAVADLLFVAMLGLISGARLGHVLFYARDAWAADPLLVLRMWEGGMSFHGGVLGVAIAVWAWARRQHIAVVDALDFLAPLVPLGLGCGRFGNFINGELWGTPTTLPWGVLFPKALAADGIAPAHVERLLAAGGGDALARHPSQLYELGLEGIVLFLLLWRFSAQPRPRGTVVALFAFAYGTLRFVVEYLRELEPGMDPLAFGGLSPGQGLCLPMIVGGGSVLWLAWRHSDGRYWRPGAVAGGRIG
jgi:phosphatidylglycerol---prolipoprotein diacylglyceryl transferase